MFALTAGGLFALLLVLFPERIFPVEFLALPLGLYKLGFPGLDKLQVARRAQRLERGQRAVNAEYV